MPIIHLTTFIEAPVNLVFDLSRSIDLHKKSMAHTQEQAVAGTTSGLIGLEETVTWKARHFYKIRYLKVKITEFRAPDSFTDEMVEGDFKHMRHQHFFRQIENGSLMIDILDFEAPYGWLGKMAERLLLTRYLKKLLDTRNAAIKSYAESGKWKFLLQV